MFVFCTLRSKDPHVLRHPEETASFPRRFTQLGLRPGLAPPWQTAGTWAGGPNRGRALKGSVLSLHVSSPQSVPWSVDVVQWLLYVWPQCVLWLAAASSSLPFPGAAKLLHTFQTLPRPQPLPSSLYLDSPRAKVLEVLALRIPCHLP